LEVTPFLMDNCPRIARRRPRLFKQAKVAEEDLLKWWTAEEQRVGKEEEEAVRATISTASEELETTTRTRRWEEEKLERGTAARAPTYRSAD